MRLRITWARLRMAVVLLDEAAQHDATVQRHVVEAASSMAPPTFSKVRRGCPPGRGVPARHRIRRLPVVDHRIGAERLEIGDQPTR